MIDIGRIEGVNREAGAVAAEAALAEKHGKAGKARSAAKAGGCEWCALPVIAAALGKGGTCGGEAFRSIAAGVACKGVAAAWLAGMAGGEARRNKQSRCTCSQVSDKSHLGWGKSAVFWGSATIHLKLQSGHCAQYVP